MHAVFVLKPLRLYAWSTNNFAHVALTVDYDYSTTTTTTTTTTAVKMSLKKMNLSSFKLNRVYLDPLNMSNAGDFSWS